ncbi:hypothetical protein N8I77_001952 [Diaporthe amygdali]|uniref:Uncharacterized protein n=1 Tax=Phomopsis amygdali TaxID=1214568 RepID=A0AAD9W8T0_PHOAM|nr:hypothetical protein N8I77_001952 [Diaporthe amygdali]
MISNHNLVRTIRERGLGTAVGSYRALFQIYGIASRVTLVRDPLSLAEVNMVLRELQALELVGRLYYGRGQPHLHVPLVVAVEKPGARVVSFEAYHRIRVAVDDDAVFVRRLGGKAGSVSGEHARVGAGRCQELELVAVEVEGV